MSRSAIGPAINQKQYLKQLKECSLHAPKQQRAAAQQVLRVRLMAVPCQRRSTQQQTFRTTGPEAVRVGAPKCAPCHLCICHHALRPAVWPSHHTTADRCQQGSRAKARSTCTNRNPRCNSNEARPRAFRTWPVTLTNMHCIPSGCAAQRPSDMHHASRRMPACRRHPSRCRCSHAVRDLPRFNA